MTTLILFSNSSNHHCTSTRAWTRMHMYIYIRAPFSLYSFKVASNRLCFCTVSHYLHCPTRYFGYIFRRHIMANVRFFALLLVFVMFVVHGALARAHNYDDFTNQEKRYRLTVCIQSRTVRFSPTFRLFFGCAKIGSRCTGALSKSCCTGSSCNRTSGKCVTKGSATSWLGDRNGK